MNCESVNSTIWNCRLVQIMTQRVLVSEGRNLLVKIVQTVSTFLARGGIQKSFKELGTPREPWGNRLVSDWQYQRQLGRLGGLDPAKSDGYFSTSEKLGRSHLICPTIGPILLPTHPLHPSWKRSSTLSMTCIIGGSFFMRSSQFLGISGHSRPQLIEVQH